MGLTVKAKHRAPISFDLGAGRFYQLRETVARYILRSNFNVYLRWRATTSDTPFKELDRACHKLYTLVGDGAYNFLIQSDEEGKLTYRQAKQLYNQLKDCKEDLSMCYAFYCTPDNRTDFLKLLEFCTQNKVGFLWC